MYHEQDALWTKVILNKYCSHLRMRLRDPEKLPTSPNWKAICLGFPIFKKGIAWGIGNGAEISDLYCGQQWNWDLVSFDLPHPIKDKIKAIPIQLHGSGRDTVLLKFSKNGEFTTSSAYRIANKGEEKVTQFHGQWIWKLDILPRITNFLWLCLHGSIPVKGVLAERGINCDKVCPLCRDHDESIVHLLRECIIACDLWSKLEVPPSHMNSFADSLEAWLKNNCLSNVSYKGSIPWCFLFVFAVWNLWKNRNEVVFDNSSPNPTLDNVCLSQAKEYYYCVSKAKQVVSRAVIVVKWFKPPPGSHKLNTDGASLGNPGKAGGGGLIRNSEEGWIKGYSRSIGLKTLTNYFAPFLLDCKSLMARLTLVRVAHVLERQTSVLIFLAKKGCCMREDFVVFDVSPSNELNRLLVSNSNGMYYYR
ncbi:hypothetical protein ACB092_11G001000 [Castanea dentata]